MEESFQPYYNFECFYAIPFGFDFFFAFGITFPFSILFVWYRISNEGSIPEMHKYTYGQYC